MRKLSEICKRIRNRRRRSSLGLGIRIKSMCKNREITIKRLEYWKLNTKKKRGNSNKHLINNAAYNSY